MSTLRNFSIKMLAASVLSVLGTSAMADDIHSALSNSKAWAELNLRYETAEEDNALEDASALTLRTRIGFSSGSVNGFSFTAEAEDSRIVLGQDEFTVGPTGFNVGEYSVIADPETTEVDQAFIQYKADKFTGRLGRQVIALDDHRFIGHVGWRQDRQTFDAISAKYNLSDNLELFYSYMYKRNRIFAEAADLDSKDHIVHASYMSKVGKFVGYAYLLEVDNDTDNALDTYGMSYDGKAKGEGVSWAYGGEYAIQSSEAGSGETATDFDASYLNAYVAATISGITAKIDYEILGSDDGLYGFATPLATLHKFNGWADLFLKTPEQGLKDLRVSLSGGLAGGKWLLAYHDFSADESSNGIDDLGSEINAQYTKKFAGKYNFGIKYGTYDSGDTKVDTNRFWMWIGTRF
ncbi:alginate export family protein [Alteromonas gracilis]|uniref:alginate export family protein n=1 Tax=Alteromonas gracilis TaxID=1479524 RepID=UPI0037356DAC